MRLCEQLGPVRDADWPPPLACPKWDMGRAVGARAVLTEGRAYAMQKADIVRASGLLLGLACYVISSSCLSGMHAR